MNNQLINIEQLEAQTIANNVYDLMKANNISESQLARELGISLMTIRRVVSGETEDPRISTLRLIADYFNVSIDSILEQTNMPMTCMKNNKPLFIPILNWDVLKNPQSWKEIDMKTWEKWYPIVNSESLQLTGDAFAIESKASMQPRFPQGTILVINPHESPRDNDIVIIKTLKAYDVSLRELIIDYPKWLLQPIIPGSEMVFYNENEHDIIGVVVLTLFHTRD
jgi:transcriptional regulator with XRE-family HTH domain